ncbi:MAG: metal ABC transporter permease [Abditibacteriota bacterium]|nr:metal ABC transporter permease [Abditibacteriota bacterium]MBP5738271.1 metal ABC transporter permease [Abditibacteriota bacterium]
MIEMFAYGYMQRALAASVIIGGLCALIGVYVVLKGLSFMGAGIAHASFAGAAIGLVSGVNPVFSATVFCVLVGWAIGVTTKLTKVKPDTAVGIFFSSAMALGILILGLCPEYRTDPFGYLFGSILTVTASDLTATVILAAVVLALLAFFAKELLFTVFDENGARVSGINANGFFLLLVTLIALTVVVSLKVVGSVLVAALIVTPAAAAQKLTRSFKKMCALSVSVGIISSVGGLIISYCLRIASGAAIVMLSAVIFFLCALFAPKDMDKKRNTK